MYNSHAFNKVERLILFAVDKERKLIVGIIAGGSLIGQPSVTRSGKVHLPWSSCTMLTTATVAVNLQRNFTDIFHFSRLSTVCRARAKHFVSDSHYKNSKLESHSRQAGVRHWKQPFAKLYRRCGRSRAARILPFTPTWIMMMEVNIFSLRLALRAVSTVTFAACQLLLPVCI